VFAEKASADLARATLTWMRDATVDDAAKLAGRLTNVEHSFAAGNAFEFMEAARFNAAAARADSGLEAVVTALRGAPSAAADIQIIGPGDDVVREVQAKLYKTAPSALHAHAQEKYEGMQRLVAADREGDARRLLAKRLGGNPDAIKMPEYRDVDANLTGRLSHAGIASDGTTYDDAQRWAHDLPGWVEEQRRSARVAEVTKAAASGALMGAGVTAVVQAVVVAMRDDDESMSRKVSDVARASAVAGLQAGALTGGARIAKFVLEDSEALSGLASTSAPVDIVRLTASVGRAGYGYATGALTLEEFQEQCARDAIRTSVGWAYGVVGQAVIPVPIVGTLVGVVVGQAVAGAMLEGMKLARAAASEADAAEERLAVLEREAVEAIRILEEQRLRLEQLQQHESAAHVRTILPLLAEISASSVAGDDRTLVAGMNELNALLGRELEWSTLEEFDGLMSDDGWTLDL
jgi:hypothetical protein